jgi:hypothetical protein
MDPQSPADGGQRSRLRIWLRRGLLLAVALLLVYLIGANLVLNTGVLRPVINRKSEKLLVEWRSGWTLIPGVVHVSGVRIRGQSKKVQWQCRVGPGSYRISLLALPTKTIRISRGRGSGFEFYLRRRLPSAEKAAALAGILPEIEGFANPPDPAPEDIYKRRKHPPKNPWFIKVSNVQFDGPIDLWLHRVRAQGHGQVGGGVRFEVRTALEVPVGRVDLNGATLTVGSDVLAHDARLEVGGSLEPFPPKGTKGLEILQKFKGELRISDGTIPDLAVISAFLPRNAGVELMSGSTSVDVDIDARRPGEATGDVQIGIEGVQMDAAGREVEGDIAIDARLMRGDFGNGRFDLDGTTLSMERMVLPDPKRDMAEIDEQDMWWSRIEVDRGWMQLGRPMRVHMDVALAMKDTKPLLKVFFAKPGKHEDEVKVPAWVRMMPNVENIEGEASLDSGPEGIVVDDVLITGDKTEVMARLWAREKKLVGQLYLRHGILHLGVDLTEDGRKMKLSKPKRWFIAQPEFGSDETPPGDNGP